MSNPGPMTCPVDGTVLTMSERQGVEIDYCPSCRGVWLDRGELDKIIERANTSAPQAPPQAAPISAPQQPWGAQPPYPSHGGYGHGQPYRGKRKKSFLEELFD